MRIITPSKSNPLEGRPREGSRFTEEQHRFFEGAPRPIGELGVHDLPAKRSRDATPEEVMRGMRSPITEPVTIPCPISRYARAGNYQFVLPDGSTRWKNRKPRDAR